MGKEDRTLSFEKDPDEEFPGMVGFEDDLAEDETISSVDVTVIDLDTGLPPDPTVLLGDYKIGTVSEDGKTFTVEDGPDVMQGVKAGVADQRVKIKVLITTSDSYKHAGFIIMTVR